MGAPEAGVGRIGAGGAGKARDEGARGQGWGRVCAGGSGRGQGWGQVCAGGRGRGRGWGRPGDDGGAGRRRAGMGRVRSGGDEGKEACGDGEWVAVLSWILFRLQRGEK